MIRSNLAGDYARGNGPCLWLSNRPPLPYSLTRGDLGPPIGGFGIAQRLRIVASCKYLCRQGPVPALHQVEVNLRQSTRAECCLYVAFPQAAHRVCAFGGQGQTCEVSVSSLLKGQFFPAIAKKIAEVPTGCMFPCDPPCLAACNVRRNCWEHADRGSNRTTRAFGAADVGKRLDAIGRNSNIEAKGAAVLVLCATTDGWPERLDGALVELDSGRHGILPKELLAKFGSQRTEAY